MPFPARWDGPALVTTTIRKVNDFPITTVERRTLNADRTEMTVETTLRVEHGYSSNGSSGGTAMDKSGQNFVTVKDVYTRSK